MMQAHIIPQFKQNMLKFLVTTLLQDVHILTKNCQNKKQEPFQGLKFLKDNLWTNIVHCFDGLDKEELNINGTLQNLSNFAYALDKETPSIANQYYIRLGLLLTNNVCNEFKRVKGILDFHTTFYKYECKEKKNSKKSDNLNQEITRFYKDIEHILKSLTLYGYLTSNQVVEMLQYTFNNYLFDYLSKEQKHALKYLIEFNVHLYMYSRDQTSKGLKGLLYTCLDKYRHSKYRDVVAEYIQKDLNMIRVPSHFLKDPLYFEIEFYSNLDLVVFCLALKFKSLLRKYLDKALEIGKYRASLEYPFYAQDFYNNLLMQELERDKHLVQLSLILSQFNTDGVCKQDCMRRVEAVFKCIEGIITGGQE